MKKSALFILLAAALSGCDETEIAKLKGSYTGTFIYHSNAEAPQSGRVTVTFEGASYTSTRNPDYIPAGGSGTFEFKEKNTVRFEDQNIWTANFDWNLILKGEYAYEIKGDSLIITRSRDEVKLYEYRLKRDQ